MGVEIARLEQEVRRIQTESQQHLEDAHGHIESLKEQIRHLNEEIALNRVRRDELELALKQSHEGLTRSDGRGVDREQIGRLEEENKQLEEQFQELKLLNQFLKDKEGLLSEELLKSQTQAMGLQKICEEFQKELGSHA